jgi:hypothetical protein
MTDSAFSRVCALAALLVAPCAWAQFQPYSVSYRDPWQYFIYSFATPITGGLDLNGDGRSDLIVPGEDLSTRIYLSQGNGRFVRKTLPFQAGGTRNFSIAGGDFDGDGRTDLAYTAEANQVRVLRNLGGANFRHYQAIATTAAGENARLSQVVGGDYNGDGRIDLAILDRGGDYAASGATAQIAWGQAGGQFDAAQNRMPVAPGSIYALAADFTGDGRADLVTGNARGEIGLSQYDAGTSTLRLVTTLVVNAGTGNPRIEGLGVGDIDGNGRVDAAVVYAYTPANSPNVRNYMLQPLRNNGQATALQLSGAPQPLTDCVSYVVSVRLGDYDGNGKTDVLLNCRNGVAAILYGHGDFTFDAPALVQFTDDADVSASGKGLARGDYDGDGKLDIAVVTQRGLRVLRYDPAADRLFADGFQQATHAAPLPLMD